LRRARAHDDPRTPSRRPGVVRISAVRDRAGSATTRRRIDRACLYMRQTMVRLNSSSDRDLNVCQGYETTEDPCRHASVTPHP
jgi:hypothetical protein